ncbi:MAG TPA: ABC transporter ATP-binding protein [Planctomycetaceae bacterium]|nr:ABC transporter ATP-binding protein [Planctomycetaceae bacterium]
MSTSLVELSHVSKTYNDGNVIALSDVSLAIHPAEFVAIVGPSGCGKSTLLNLLGALDRPSEGLVSFEGETTHNAAQLDRLRSQKIGFVFQSFYLLPNLTAEENVQLPMFESSLGPPQRTQRARELLEDVGLSERRRHLPNQLSIGQRQRVAIARALANSPELILADEPTGSLDSKSGAEVMDLLASLNDKQSTALVVVTHDDRVAALARRCIRMLDGRIL